MDGKIRFWEFKTIFGEFLEILSREHLTNIIIGKKQSSAVFFFGFLLIVLKFGFLGGAVQLWSLFMLFKSFLPYILEYAYSVPVIGPFLSK